MSFEQDNEHPYFAEYEHYLERLLNGGDCEKAFKALCRDIIEYDVFHAECINIVKDYENGRKE